MAENSTEVELALLKKANDDNTKKLDKQDEIVMGLITAVQDLKTKFYLLGVGFPTLLTVVGLLKSFGVFAK